MKKCIYPVYIGKVKKISEQSVETKAEYEDINSVYGQSVFGCSSVTFPAIRR